MRISASNEPVWACCICSPAMIFWNRSYGHQLKFRCYLFHHSICCLVASFWISFVYVVHRFFQQVVQSPRLGNDMCPLFSVFLTVQSFKFLHFSEILFYTAFKIQFFQAVCTLTVKVFVFPGLWASHFYATKILFGHLYIDLLSTCLDDIIFQIQMKFMVLHKIQAHRSMSSVVM